MTTTRLGAIDMRPLQELLHKPSHSLAMSFSSDPNAGHIAEPLRWSGDRLPGDHHVYDAIDRSICIAHNCGALIPS